MSYDGRIDFGLIADFDAVPDLDEVADALERGDRGVAPSPAAPVATATAALRLPAVTAH